MQNQILYGIARANSTLSTPLNLHKSDTTTIPKAIADVFDTTEKLWTDREALKAQLEKLKAALAVAERKNAQKFSTPNDPDSAGQKPCTPLKDEPYVKGTLLAVRRIKSDRDSLRTDIEGLTIKLEQHTEYTRVLRKENDGLHARARRHEKLVQEMEMAKSKSSCALICTCSNICASKVLKDLAEEGFEDTEADRNPAKTIHGAQRDGH